MLTHSLLRSHQRDIFPQISIVQSPCQSYSEETCEQGKDQGSENLSIGKRTRIVIGQHSDRHGFWKHHRRAREVRRHNHCWCRRSQRRPWLDLRRWLRVRLGWRCEEARRDARDEKRKQHHRSGSQLELACQQVKTDRNII